jgi:O-antigen/teichoic acid export membrane protein
MSRRASFSRAVGTGLLNTVFNTAYTLLSIPLALAYLDTSEFGLWVIVSQVIIYLALLEPCLSGSISRTLIAERPGTAGYAQVVLSGFIACTLQGLLVVCVGLAIAPWLSHWLEVPARLQADFDRLYLWQLAAVGLSSVPRMFSHVLVARQRQDVVNNVLSASFIAMYVTQWYAFSRGAGLLSLFWGNVAGLLVNSLVPWVAASRMKLLPESFSGFAFEKSKLAAIIRFAGELALQVLGWHLIAGTQIFLIKVHIGLEAAGIFAVCTKTAGLLQSILFRILDFSVPGLSNMVTEGDQGRLKVRFLQLVGLSAASAAAAFVLFACLNQPFVSWWTSGEVGWSRVNDWLLAALYFVYSITRANGAFCWVVKRPELIRMVYLIEGFAVIALGSIITPVLGIPGLIALCVLLNVTFSGLWAGRRLAQGQVLPSLAVLKAAKAGIVLFLLFGVVAVGWTFLWRSTSPVLQFTILGLALVPLAAWAVWRYGIPPELRQEISGSIRVRLKR